MLRTSMLNARYISKHADFQAMLFGAAKITRQYPTQFGGEG
jgi:hypothetical protein